MRVARRAIGIILAASVLLSDILSLGARAAEAQAYGAETAAQAAPDYELTDEAAQTVPVTEADQEDGENGVGEVATESGTGGESGTGEAATDGAENPDGTENPDAESGAEIAVTVESVSEDVKEEAVLEEAVMPRKETRDNNGEIQWQGHSIPISNYMLVSALDLTGKDNTAYNMLTDAKDDMGGHWSYDGGAAGGDWAYALCNSLESSLKKKKESSADKSAVSIDRQALVDYLYKGKGKKDKYGSISKDCVKDPGNGKGNIHTAMWAAASGYAGMADQGRKYTVDNIYIYDALEYGKIKDAIRTRGEVATSIYMTDRVSDFKKEGNGAYPLSYHCPVSERSKNEEKVEHAVNIVGWDDNYSYENFLNKESFWDSDAWNGAWLVKDSYGGQGLYRGDRYYWVSYYETLNKIEENDKVKYEREGTNFYSFDVREVGENDHTYQHDGGGSYFMYGAVGYDKAVNIFPKAGAREELDSISFGTYTRKAKYAIQVYLEAAPAKGNGQPVREKPLFEKPIVTETYPQWGYYTVELSEYKEQYVCEPYIRNSDEQKYFAVEITILPGDGFGKDEKKAFWIDGRNNRGVKPECIQNEDAFGQSYVWKDGKWVDFSQDMEEWSGGFLEGKGSNIRIKAHTQDAFSIKAPGVPEVWMGETLPLQACIGDDSAQGLQWSSDNGKVADVDAKGVVTPKAPGYATITVQSEQYGSDSIRIMVKDVDFGKSQPVLYSNSKDGKDRSAQITCAFSPVGYEPQAVAYVLDAADEEFLGIDENGRLTAKNERFKKDIKVKVDIMDREGAVKRKEVPVSCRLVPERFNIIEESQGEKKIYEVRASEQMQLKVDGLEPEGAVGDVLWSSSDPAVALVTKSGKVSALKAGTATVTAKSRVDQDVNASVQITVKAGANLAFTEDYITLSPGESKELKLAEDMKDIAWSLTDMDGNRLDSGGGASVSFDAQDMRITAKGENEIRQTRFRLCATSGGMSATCFIKIDVPVKNIKLSLSPQNIVPPDGVIKASASILERMDVKLDVSFDPAGLMVGDVPLVYSTSDARVAGVRKDGRVDIRQKGSVTLTARTENGLSDSVDLVVESIYSGTVLALDADTDVLYDGGGYLPIEPDKVKLRVRADGIEADAEDFSWTSSDRTVAEVDSQGRVVAKSEGSAMITAVDRLDSGNKIEKWILVKTGIKEVELKDAEIEIAKYCTVKVKYNVMPENASNAGRIDDMLYLVSDNTNYFTCRDNRITAYGTAAYGTAGVMCGNKRLDNLNVLVMGKTASSIDIGLTRDGVSVNTLKTKGTKEAGAQIKAAAYDVYRNSAGISQKFTYESLTPDIVRVDDKGYVYCIVADAPKRAWVRVCARDGSGLARTHSIEIEAAESGIEKVLLNHGSAELVVGEEMALIASVFAEGKDGDSEVAWESNNPKVASVGEDGLVSAVGCGTAEITAKSLGGTSAKCVVKVSSLDSALSLLKPDNAILESVGANPSSFYQTVVYTSDRVRRDASLFKFSSSNEKVCTIDGDGRIVPALSASKGTSVITVELKGDVWRRKTSFKVTLTDQAQAAGIELYAALRAWEEELGSGPVYLPFVPGKDIDIRGEAVGRNGNALEGTDLKWTVSDSKVIAVKVERSGRTAVTIKRSGSCVLTCSVKKQPQVAVSVPVYVYDKKPVLTEKNLTVNLRKEEDIIIPIQECAGTKITSLDVAYIKKGKKELPGSFDIAESGEGYCLKYDAAKLAKGDYTVGVKADLIFDGLDDVGKKLQEFSRGRSSYSEVLEIPVKVIDQKPSVRIERPVLNVFERDAGASLKVITNGEVENIRLKSASDFRILPAEEGFRIEAGARIKTGKSFKVPLLVYLKGYIDPVPVDCAVKTVVQALKLKTAQATLYAYRGADADARIAFPIIDAGTGRPVSSEVGYSVAGSGVSFEGEEVRVSGLNQYGKRQQALTIRNSKLWNGKVELKVPIVVDAESKLAAVVSEKKIELNKKAINDCAAVAVNMKQSNIKIEKVTVKILDSKGEESAAVRAERKDSMVEFRLADDCVPGKYRAEVTVETDLSDEKTGRKKSVKEYINITVRNAPLSIRPRLKGSIDIYDREGTSMTGALDVYGVAGKVSDITCLREDFSVRYDAEAGQLALSLKPGYMVSQLRQTIPLEIKMQSGVKFEKSIDIRLRQPQIKWKKQKDIVFYKSKGGREARVAFVPENLPGATAEVKAVNLPKGMEADSVEDGSLKVRITDEGVKLGAYRITVAVRVRGRDEKPVYSVPIKQTVTVYVK